MGAVESRPRGFWRVAMASGGRWGRCCGGEGRLPRATFFVPSPTAFECFAWLSHRMVRAHGSFHILTSSVAIDRNNRLY
jgi:hypothetical protein